MRRIVPKRRKWPLAGMLASLLVVAACAMAVSLPPSSGKHRSTDRIALVAGSAGLAGGLVSWTFSRDDRMKF